MKKFITTLAAALVIGSAASAATPVTFGDVYGDIVYHDEVAPTALPTFSDVYGDIVYHEEVVPMSAPATFAEVYGDIAYHEEVVPVAGADTFTVASN